MPAVKPRNDSIWLLDGSIYFFRGYFGMPETLVDAAGEFCGGVHGFARALLLVLERHGPGNGLVAFDQSLGSCFRNDIYPGYKANRAPPDDNTIYQFSQCERLCDLLGLGRVADTRFEADDLLATAAKRARKSAIIYSKDKDLRQLVDANCTLQDLLGDDLHDARSFARDYGFAAALFPDYQALVGDTSDNVPGIAGFGPKTAARLIGRYGSLESVVAAREQFSTDKVGVPSEGKLATNLVAGMNQALEMREVLRLSTQAPLPAGATRRRAIQAEPLAQFLDTMRLRTFSRGLQRLGLLPRSHVSGKG